jgi:hypothetical protein
MKYLFLAVTVLLVSSFPLTKVFAKNGSIGVYALIDRVTFEPNGTSPDTVRISGVFVVPKPMSSGEYLAPQRGYISLRMPPGQYLALAIRNDWKALGAAAGSGQVVGFGQYWVPNPNDRYGNPHNALLVRVWAEDNAASWDAYPLPHPRGIIKTGDAADPEFESIAAKLRAYRLR